MNRQEEYKKLYESGMSHKEIGEKFNISRQRVHQIIHKDKYKKAKKIKRELDLNLAIIERKRIIYPLIERAGNEQIKKVLQSLVNYNQQLRPIENYFDNIAKSTGLLHGGRERYRELVRIRDNQKCQLCGLKKIKRKLDIHHIYDENGENTKKCDKEFNKQITLCHQCHSRINNWKMNGIAYSKIHLKAAKIDKNKENMLSTFGSKEDLTLYKKGNIV